MFLEIFAIWFVQIDLIFFDNENRLQNVSHQAVRVLSRHNCSKMRFEWYY